MSRLRAAGRLWMRAAFPLWLVWAATDWTYQVVRYHRLSAGDTAVVGLLLLGFVLHLLREQVVEVTATVIVGALVCWDLLTGRRPWGD